MPTLPGVRHAGDEAVVDDNVQRFYRREPGDERRAHDNAEEERGIDLLGDQRQTMATTGGSSAQMVA